MQLNLSAPLSPTFRTDYTPLLSGNFGNRDVDSWNKESYALRAKNPNESLELAKKSLYLSTEQSYRKGVLEARLNIGFNHMYKGEHRQALEEFTEVYFESEELDDYRLMARANYNVGVLYLRIQVIDQAIEFLEKAKQFFVKINDQAGLSKCHFQFATIRFNTGDYAEALKAVEMALKMERQNQDKGGIAANLTLLGRIQMKLGEMSSAQASFDESIELRKEENDQIGLSSCMYYQLEVYGETGRWDIVKEKIEEVREVFEKSTFIMGVILFKQLRAKCEYHYENFQNAIALHEECIKLSTESNLKIYSVSSFKDISFIHERQEDFKKALLYHKFYVQGKEEVTNIKSKIKLENIKLHREVNDMKKTAQLERFKREELSLASESITNMHRELKSSLVYAKRIHDAIMPSEAQVNCFFPENFIINLPKEIVSGDFLWMNEAEGAKYVAVADCTGHGVPGAILSVYAFNTLNKTLVTKGIKEPNEILNEVRNSFIIDFMSEKATIKDGMDISLIRLEDRMMTFSGAYRTMYVVRQGVLIELKGDRQPVGLFQNMNSFQNVNFELELGDQIFLFSDGVTDQMGGVKMKKLKPKQFKEWVLEISDTSLDKQSHTLSKRLDEWRGPLSQTDDMLLFSFRVGE
jgi:serine phosphatase RsbU (regulator of sigma subunit)